jgi:hypothetical protein
VAMDNPLFIQAGINLRTSQTGKETENKTTNRYQLLTRMTCNKFRVFLKKNKKTRERKLRHSGLACIDM